MLVANAGLVALAVLGAAAGAWARPSASSVRAVYSATYDDTVGESGGGPEIMDLVVSNDDAGMMAAAIRFANRSALGATELVSLDLDTDRDEATGEPALGWDYGIQVYAAQTLLFRYDRGNKDWALAPTKTLTAAWSGSTLTLRLSARELGWPTSFRFEAYADANPANADAPFDVAPDVGREWTYTVRLPAAKLVIRTLDCTPEPAIAGKLLMARAVVSAVRGGVAEPLPPTAKVTWNATLGATKLRPLTTKTANGTLTSTWKLPQSVQAKAVKVTVTVTSNGATVSKTHLHRVLARSTSSQAARTAEPTTRGDEPTKRVRAVFKLMLLTPTQDQVIPQNDPATGCPANSIGGYGSKIRFSWQANHSKAITLYHLVAQHRDATIPIVEWSGLDNSYTFLSCGYVVPLPSHLDGWQWRIDALAQGTSVWKEGSFRFGPP